MRETCEALARTPWRSSPSSFAARDSGFCPALTHIDLGVRVPRQNFGSATERGSAYHLAFRVLAERPEFAPRLPAATGLSDDTIKAIVGQAAAVRTWLDGLGFTQTSFELPLQLRADDGSETNAIIDLLAESDDALAIVDHKTGPCPDPNRRFGEYLPQLKAYADLLTEHYPEKPVRFLVINWMDEGQISVADVATLMTEEAA
ncbi:hypothetical protein D9M68_340800 [compost metagenome]